MKITQEQSDRIFSALRKVKATKGKRGHRAAQDELHDAVAVLRNNPDAPVIKL